MAFAMVSVFQLRCVVESLPQMELEEGGPKLTGSQESLGRGELPCL